MTSARGEHTSAIGAIAAKACAALLVAVAACGGAQVEGRSTRDGTAIWVDLDSVGRAIEPRRRDDHAAVAQAAVDFGCDVASVVARPIDLGIHAADDYAYRVEGCGKGGVYLAVRLYGLSSRAPGWEGHAENVDLRRYVNVASEDALPGALRDLDAHALAIQLAPRPGSYRNSPRILPRDGEYLLLWARRIQRAARELACSPNATTLAIDSRWEDEELHVSRVQKHFRDKQCPNPPRYVVEGCGCKGVLVEPAAGVFQLQSRAATDEARAGACGVIAPPPPCEQTR